MNHEEEWQYINKAKISGLLKVTMPRKRGSSKDCDFLSGVKSGILSSTKTHCQRRGGCMTVKKGLKCLVNIYSITNVSAKLRGRCQTIFGGASNVPPLPFRKSSKQAAFVDIQYSNMLFDDKTTPLSEHFLVF